MDGLPETGFLRDPLLRCEDLGKNPVSKDWMGCQKPGFCQNICYGAKIWEKTRFLKIGWVARNRVFLRLFVIVDKNRKNPVSFSFALISVAAPLSLSSTAKPKT